MKNFSLNKKSGKAMYHEHHFAVCIKYCFWVNSKENRSIQNTSFIFVNWMSVEPALTCNVTYSYVGFPGSLFTTLSHYQIIISYNLSGRVIGLFCVNVPKAKFLDFCLWNLRLYSVRTFYRILLFFILFDSSNFCLILCSLSYQ